MKKYFSFLSIVLLMASSITVFAQGKINKNGERVGKWKVLYKLTEVKHIDFGKVVDWQNSLTEVSNIEECEYFEIVKYEKGKKEGIFELYQNKKLTNSSGYVTYPIVLYGAYSNGLKNGLTTFTSTDSKNKICDVNYLNGEIVDQKVSFYKTRLEDFNIDFESYFVIKNKKTVESVVLKDKMPLKLTCDENNLFTLLYYTQTPICYNDFSTLTEDEKYNNKIKSIIDLNTNNFALEKYELKIKPNGDLFMEGNYRLFKPVDKLFDTTFLWADFTYINGLRNGPATIWDAEKNGKSNVMPIIVQNYTNDLLDGDAVFYYPDGKPAYKANFKGGYVEGVVTSYLHPNFKPVEIDYYIKPYVNAGTLSIHQIGKFSVKLYENIQNIKSKGGEIDNPNEYQLYSQINYRTEIGTTPKGDLRKISVPSEDFIQYLNGKHYAVYLIDKTKSWEPKDIIYYDKTGKEVFSLKSKKESDYKQARELIEMYSNISNSDQKCASCSKNFKYGDAKRLSECLCFDTSKNQNITLLINEKLFCSLKCKNEYESDCCKRNGKSSR
jgi:hypothetical protein